MLEPDGKAGNLRELLKQQWDHARHMEMERAYLLMAYGAILAVFFAFGKGGNPALNLEANWLLIFLLFITFFCFFQTTRWTYAFECHREKANKIARILWQQTGDKTSLDPTFNIPPIQTIPTRFLFIKGRKWERIASSVNEHTRTRYIYPTFYFFFIVCFSVLSFTNVGEIPTAFECHLFSPKTIEVTTQLITITTETTISTTKTATTFAPIINQWFAIVIFILALISFCNWYMALNNIRKRIVVLEGRNSMWSNSKYFPLLNTKTEEGNVELWSVDIKDSTEPLVDNAHYINKYTQINRYFALSNINLVFVVTPPMFHIELAKFWLPKLAKDGKIFIEKPLDDSINKAEDFRNVITKKERQNMIYGFDHYLARAYPFLKDKARYINGIGGIEKIEFRILENSPILLERMQTLNSGIILDLFSHVLSVVSATLSQKPLCTAEFINNVSIDDIFKAKYHDSPISNETFAQIGFTVNGIKIDASLGKCVGSSEEKSMILNGERGQIILDFSNDLFYKDTISNESCLGTLNPNHVETYLEKVLELDKKGTPLLIPGVFSFDTALKILEKSEEAKNKIDNTITNKMPEYQCGASLEGILKLAKKEIKK